MLYDRRTLLSSILPVALLGPSLVGCATMGVTDTSIPTRKVALLLPLSGQSAEIGKTMERAVRSRLGAQPSIVLDIYDSSDDAATAAAAAVLAVEDGAEIILGPLFSTQVPPVLDVTGDDVAVVSFSNDPRLSGSGALVTGVTADQSVSAVLRYARRQGVRHVQLPEPTNLWSRSVCERAREEAGRLGMAIAQRDGDAVDAVLLPDTSDASAALARESASRGVQLLGTDQFLYLAPQEIETYTGIWFAALEYERLFSPSAGFSFAPEMRTKTFAALAYEVAGVALFGSVEKSTLLSAGIHDGVMGRFSFRPDGTVLRDMAIYTANGGAPQLVARTPFTASSVG